MLGSTLRSPLRSPLYSPLVGKWGGDTPFSPLSLFAGGEEGAWYEVDDLTTLWQDAAGTTPADTLDDEVRRIDDKSGNGNHLLILTTGTPGILKQVNGKWVVRCGVGAAFKTAGNKNLQLPLYICAGLVTGVAADSLVFGVVRSATTVCAIRQHSQQNIIKTYIRDTVPGTLVVSTDPEAAPLNAPLVADSLNIAGTSDIRVNGGFADSAANTWDGSSHSTTAVYGLNMASNVAANPSLTLDFFGGFIVHANPGSSKRAGAVSYFQEKVDRVPEDTDINILIAGDSTGVDRVGSVSIHKDWPYHFALTPLAAADATAYVGMRLFNKDSNMYGPEVIMQAGTGGPAYVIKNASVAGSTPDNFIDNGWYNKAIVQVPAPDYFWMNFGHNMNNPGTDPAVYTRFWNMVRAQWPGMVHGSIRQNPWRTSDSMNAIIATHDAVCLAYGDVSVANVYDGYINYVPTKDASLYADGVDNVHPSEFGVTEVWLPAVTAAWAAMNS